jgi:hypothetical protein
MNRNSRTTTQQHGFTVLQMVITIVIIAIVSSVGVLGIQRARAEFRLWNSARVFGTYVEKARADSVRRHATSDTESSIETFGPGTNTYAVTMDFGSGTVETRTFTLDSGLNFPVIAKKVSFNWRGRIAEAWVFQIYSAYLDYAVPIDVSGSGDITVGNQHFLDQDIPDVEISAVTGDIDPDPSPTSTPAIGASPSPEETPTPTPNASPTPTPNGNGNGNGSDNGNNGNGNGNASPTPTPSPSSSPSPGVSPSPSPTIQQCASSISPNVLELSQSDTTRQTGTATFTMTNATGVRIISASQAGNGNSLVTSLSLQRIDGNGSSVLSVTTKHGAGNRGVFILEVSASPSCGSTQQVEVRVGN